MGVVVNKLLWRYNNHINTHDMKKITIEDTKKQMQHNKLIDLATRVIFKQRNDGSPVSIKAEEQNRLADALATKWHLLDEEEKEICAPFRNCRRDERHELPYKNHIPTEVKFVVETRKEKYEFHVDYRKDSLKQFIEEDFEVEFEETGLWTTKDYMNQVKNHLHDHMIDNRYKYFEIEHHIVETREQQATKEAWLSSSNKAQKLMNGGYTENEIILGEKLIQYCVILEIDWEKWAMLRRPDPMWRKIQIEKDRSLYDVFEDEQLAAENHIVDGMNGRARLGRIGDITSTAAMSTDNLDEKYDYKEEREERISETNEGYHWEGISHARNTVEGDFWV